MDDKIAGIVMGHAIGDTLGGSFNFYTRRTSIMINILESIVHNNDVVFGHIFEIIKQNIDIFTITTDNSNACLILTVPIAIYSLRLSDSEIKSLVSKLLAYVNYDSHEAYDAMFIYVKILHFLMNNELYYSVRDDFVKYVMEITNSDNVDYHVKRKINMVIGSYQYYCNNTIHRGIDIDAKNVEMSVMNNIHIVFNANITQTLSLALNAFVWNFYNPNHTFDKCVSYGGHINATASIAGSFSGALYGMAGFDNYIHIYQNYNNIHHVAKMIKPKDAQMDDLSSFMDNMAM